GPFVFYSMPNLIRSTRAFSISSVLVLRARTISRKIEQIFATAGAGKGQQRARRKKRRAVHDCPGLESCTNSKINGGRARRDSQRTYRDPNQASVRSQTPPHFPSRAHLRERQPKSVGQFE